jgi:hypothetical protein
MNQIKGGEDAGRTAGFFSACKEGKIRGSAAFCGDLLFSEQSKALLYLSRFGKDTEGFRRLITEWS